MGVYNDMANDAGYSYGTDENEMMAMMIEEDYRRQMEAEEEEEAYWNQYWEDYWHVVETTCFGI